MFIFILYLVFVGIYGFIFFIILKVVLFKVIVFLLEDFCNKIIIDFFLLRYFILFVFFVVNIIFVIFFNFNVFLFELIKIFLY